jgi:hypothetical protein
VLFLEDSPIAIPRSYARRVRSCKGRARRTRSRQEKLEVEQLCVTP